MTALDFLKRIREMHALPPGINMAGKGIPASNSEIKRWLKSKSVVINGQRPGPFDEIEFPVWQLVFFPKGKRRTTLK